MLKIAKVSPIFRQVEKENLKIITQFHYIYLSKIIKNLMHSRLFSCLEHNDILHHSQHDFQAQKFSFSALAILWTILLLI